jgi:hypothetical protein
MNDISSNPIIITDMSLCLPAVAIIDGIKEGCWRKCSYETIDGTKGTMLFAAPEDHAQEIMMPLNLSGWFRIYIGVNFTRGSEYSHNGQLFLKLTGEEGFTPVSWEDMDDRVEPLLERFKINFANITKEVENTSIYEIFWRTADLTSKSICIRLPDEPYARNVISNISYIKLVPLNTEELNEYKLLCENTNTKKLNMMWCTAILSGSTKGEKMFRPKDKQFFYDAMQSVIESDVESLSFEAIRGNICLFKTKIGDTGEGDCRWNPEWIDPLETMTELCHNNKIKIFASCRMIGAWYPVKRGPMHRAKFYWEHPEYRQVDENGIYTSNLSLAFPEVRNFWISMLKETLSYGIDGVHIYLNRCYPYVLYEKPVIEDFIGKYGCDPRKLPLNDPRWIEHYTSYTTQFIYEVRKMLDETSLNLQLAITVNAAHLNSINPDHVLKYTFDVDEWIRRELVNIIIPTKLEDVYHIKRWNELSGGNVKIMPDLLPRTMPGELYCAIAEEYYNSGAWGFSFWDAQGRPPRSTEWGIAKYLGHRENLEFLREESKHYEKKVIQLKYINNMSVEHSFHCG